MSNKKISIVIPIHKVFYDKNNVSGTLDYLKLAIKSLVQQTSQDFKLVYVFHKSVAEADRKTVLGLNHEGLELEYYINEGEINYQSQINAFSDNHLNTEYFMILQFDDTLYPNWMKNANEYIIAYPNNEIFIPITLEKTEQNTFLGFANESVWVKGETNEQGYFDLASSENSDNFINYNLCGAVIKSETFVEVGRLKPSMFRFSDYEFLLRNLHLGKTVQVVPKLGYVHVNGRVGSIFDTVKKMSSEEATFWFKTAKSEYNYDYDRDVKFTPRTLQTKS